MSRKNESKTIEIEIEVHEVDGQFIGVINRGNAQMIISRKCNSETQAIRHAKRSFWNAVHCSHEIVFDTDGAPYPVDCDAAGNEIYGYQAECKKCGYIDQYEAEY